MLSNESFFNSISTFYDEMTGSEKVLQARKNAYKNIISGEKTIAADLGCGTGLDSIALALNGLTVSGFDLSPGMLEKAAKKAAALQLDINFHNYSIANIPDEFSNKFSFAVSMGNTLANLDRLELRNAVKKISQILEQGGKLLIQILNYARIIKKRERIIKITGEGEKYYVRFYDFHEDRLDFNILSFDKKELKNKHLSTTRIYPYTSMEMTEMLAKEGFKEIECFGSLNMDAFDIENSQDLIISAVNKEIL
jgi:glycine/sarcosine N-methyltransferase